MTLTSSQVDALLATPDGRAFSEAVRRALWVERFRNGRVRDVDAVIRKVAERLRGAVGWRLDRMAGRGAAALSTVGMHAIEARVGEVLREAAPTVLSMLAPALREMATKQGAAVGVNGARALGSTAKQHFAAWQASVVRDVRGAIALGVAQGDEANVIAARVDVALARARRNAATLVRTMADSVAVQAREREIERSGYEMVRYVAILDERTTDICESLNGSVWPVNEGPRPPQHYGCRSFIAPAEAEDARFEELTLEQWEEAA